MAMAALSGMHPAQTGANTTPTLSEASGTKQTPANKGTQAPGDTKSDRLGTGGYIRRHKAPVGKRYRASVRQHQRHAAKARNRKA